MAIVLRKKKSVRFTLYIYNLLLIILTVGFFSTFFYWFTSRLLKNRVVDNFKDISTSLVSNLDNEILKMNILSLNVAYSKMFEDLVAERLSLYSVRSEKNKTAEYRASKRLSDYLLSNIIPFKPVPQINYYDFKGGMVGAGIYSQAAAISLEDVPWLTHIDTSSGRKTFTAPHRDELLETTFPLYKNQYYVSLYRTLFNNFGEPVGVIEIKQFADMMFKGFTRKNSAVYVFDGAGGQIYPYGVPRRPFRMSELGGLREGEIAHLVNAETSKREIVIVSSPKQADWKVVIATEEKTFLKPVRRSTAVILLASVALMGAALFFSFAIAKRITLPIKRIHTALNDLDWNSITSTNPSEISSSLNEFEELEVALRRMHLKLKDSLEQVLQSKSREYRATMLALQSQMDPHFIYNILTTVSIMAEEGMVRDISVLVDNLTHLLRYISGGKVSGVTMREEIEYAKRYLACMKIRFSDSLFYDVSVPGEIAEVKVPKLIIQPLIENALKYGMSSAPPWNVRVAGEAESETWRIEISDNGPGFSEESLSAIRSRMDSWDGGRLDAGLQIHGMGLLNIYYRLRLYYGGEARFTVGNAPSGGARVSIGGPYEPKPPVHNDRR
jgi:two-component system sensor histidine kinase YesM